MQRSTLCSLAGILLALQSLQAQSFTSGSNPFVPAAQTTTAMAGPAAYSQSLDNELKEVKLRYEKGVAITQGRAAVILARLNEELVVSQARFEHSMRKQQLHKERQQILSARDERQRELARVDVDISRRLQWPEPLRSERMSAARLRMERALGGDRRYVASGATVQVDAVRRMAAEKFAHLRPLRDELGDQRLIEAKRYLDGLVRAAEAADGTVFFTSDLAAAK